MIHQYSENAFFFLQFAGSRIVILSITDMEKFDLIKVVTGTLPVGMSVTNIVTYQIPSDSSQLSQNTWLVLSGPLSGSSLRELLVSDGIMVVANTRDIFQLVVDVKCMTNELILVIGDDMEVDIRARMYDVDGKGIKINKFEMVGTWPKNFELNEKYGHVTGKPEELLESSDEPDTTFHTLQIQVFFLLTMIRVVLYVIDYIITSSCQIFCGSISYNLFY